MYIGPGTPAKERDLHVFVLQHVAVASDLVDRLALGDRSFGQVTDGNLVGTIYDTSGKVVPDASVGAKNTATGVIAETKSDQSGAYRFNNLPVGSYSVTVSSAGFASCANQGSQCRAEQDRHG